MMKKKAIGIITLPGNFNYGNRLQCYAMVESVRSVGCEPYVLERAHSFSPCRRAYYRLKSAFLSLVNGGVGADAEKRSSPARMSAFEDFGNRIPIITIPDGSLPNHDEYDFFIVGSDQVWNPSGIAHQEQWYFAGFARPEQRMAVAASLGVDEFSSAKQAKCISEGVKGFAKVSVRERRGAELIGGCSGVSAEVVCDPTLVVRASQWREVSDDRDTPSCSYVFTYLLGGVNPEAADVLEEVTNHGSIPVVPLSDRQKPGEPDAGPAEFISLIDNASHVVTDSFHAAVFSSILHTPLTIVHREGGESMFGRLETLSQMLGIEEKVYGSLTYDISRAGDYDGVDEAIARERERFMDFLKDCLDVDAADGENAARG